MEDLRQRIRQLLGEERKHLDNLYMSIAEDHAYLWLHEGEVENIREMILRIAQLFVQEHKDRDLTDKDRQEFHRDIRRLLKDPDSYLERNKTKKKISEHGIENWIREFKPLVERFNALVKRYEFGEFTKELVSNQPAGKQESRVRQRLKTYLGKEFSSREMEIFYTHFRFYRSALLKLEPLLQDMSDEEIRSLEPQRIIKRLGLIGKDTPKEIQAKVHDLLNRLKLVYHRGYMVQRFKNKHPDPTAFVNKECKRKKHKSVGFVPLRENSARYVDENFGIGVRIPADRMLDVCVAWVGVDRQHFGTMPAGLNSQLSLRYRGRKVEVPFTLYQEHVSDGVVRHEDQHARYKIVSALMSEYRKVDERKLDTTSKLLLRNERFLEKTVKNELIAHRYDGGVNIRSFLPPLDRNHKEYNYAYKECLADMLRICFEDAGDVAEYTRYRKIALEIMNSNYRVGGIYNTCLDGIFAGNDLKQAVLTCELIPMAQYQLMERIVREKGCSCRDMSHKGEILWDTDPAIDCFRFENTDQYQALIHALKDLSHDNLDILTDFLVRTHAGYSKTVPQLSRSAKAWFRKLQKLRNRYGKTDIASFTRSFFGDTDHSADLVGDDLNKVKKIREMLRLLEGNTREAFSEAVGIKL